MLPLKAIYYIPLVFTYNLIRSKENNEICYFLTNYYLLMFTIFKTIFVLVQQEIPFIFIIFL